MEEHNYVLVYYYDFSWLAELINHTHHMTVERET